jgi:peptide/nickel transport system permease protein
VAIVLALPLGVVAAIRRGTWVDTLATVASLSGISIPQMMFAPLLLLWGFVTLGWFPGPTEIGPRAIVLPALAVGTHLMAMLARMTRSSMVEVLGEDYVRTARAKGLLERVVILRHALRNALIPFVTIVVFELPGIFGGAIITETVFNWPGMGRLYYDALGRNDYPVAMAFLIIVAVLTVIATLLRDILYTVADPRIRLS